MIFWNDFFINDSLGTTQVLPEERSKISKQIHHQGSHKVCHQICLGSPWLGRCIMEDASTIQETTQDAWSVVQMPARKVGKTTRNKLATVAEGMEANCQKPASKDKVGASS